ncbi:mitochondrial methylmalonyl-CoA epimerase [Obelidium mucronatum]|nr:mitochondrial methylmalonyl-CoA epimerase [Obelidium mucronatum]
MYRSCLQRSATWSNRTILQSRAFVAVPPAAANNKVWELGVLNHVAIATPNLEKATAFYRDVLKGQCSEQIALPEHGVTTVFVNLGNTKIELLHPLGDKSPISGFLAKNKDGGMHHICLEVDNVYIAMEDVKTKGIRVLDKEPKIGAHGKPVVFLHPKDCGGVLIELEQR